MGGAGFPGGMVPGALMVSVSPSFLFLRLTCIPPHTFSWETTRGNSCPSSCERIRAGNKGKSLPLSHILPKIKPLFSQPP